MAQVTDASALRPLSTDLKTEITLSEFSSKEFDSPLPNLPMPFDLLKIVIPSNNQRDTTGTDEVADSMQTVGEVDTQKTTPKVVIREDKSRFFNDSLCVDLVFDTVKVVKMTEKYIELEYSIVNKGTMPAPIFGAKRTIKDNVAVHFYFSGTPRLTRGAILADGIFLTKGLRETKGMLAPNAVYTNRFKLSLEKRNHFYGVIILQLDVFDVLRHECDETNNVYSIVPRWY